MERVPWADKWQRVTHALARAVAALARVLDWTSVATHFRLNWKTVTAIVEGAVLWGLAHRRWCPLHVLGVDEVSRRKGQQYLTSSTTSSGAGWSGWAATARRPPCTVLRLAGPAPRPEHPHGLL